ncbi:methyltransferase domain-containing protein [Patescibacteria group bacterium]|uniref:Methyltransferase domain-containing protein n=1 Tax=candidate division WWE3 bacterium TaxID=2053526 RepID=A0A928TX44_UNCKA|nr:methyltransferase domain-containing protein [candidate division WWE3 bacterium]MCL4732348.1 methyltransferase domain-containing protein [Patescibacteria group bacterium]MDL1952773.1 methyltransferase domain-containing protein [Candidatus Uhrbacteria bacterium UHB]RIL01009.1 MAG: hypothetical protein DCC77_00510 [Candidatus Uhrbacteria bacterium]
MMIRSGTELINPFKVLERVGIRERMRIADLGCGSLGHFVFPAAQLAGPKGKIYAVDILREVLEIIEHRAKDDQFYNIETIWSDIDVYRATRIPEGGLDICLLVNNLFLSQNKPNLAKEMARLIKKGGLALVIDWKPSQTPIGPPADQRVSPEEAQAIFDIPEFSLTDTFEPGRFHYGLLFKRTDAQHVPPGGKKPHRRH